MATAPPTRRPRTRTLSYSEVTSALTCEARWDFSYGGHLAGTALRPRQTAAILSDGRAWGAGVAAWHAHALEPTAEFAAQLALAESLDEDATAQADAGFRVDPVSLVERRDRLGAILDHYMTIADPMLGLDRLEGLLDVTIPGRSSARSSSRYRFEAFIDGFYEADHPWVAEFKLRKSLTPVSVLTKMRQPAWYAYARARELDWRGPVGVMIDERLNEAPKPARLVKANARDIVCPVCLSVPAMPCVDAELRPIRAYHDERKAKFTVSTAIDQLTTVELYERACFDHDAPCDIDVLRTLRERKWQQRVPLVFSPQQIEQAGRELASAGVLIRDLDSGTRFPIRNGTTMNCRGCRFEPICDAPDEEFAIDLLFERTLPKRERPPREDQ